MDNNDLLEFHHHSKKSRNSSRRSRVEKIKGKNLDVSLSEFCSDEEMEEYSRNDYDEKSFQVVSECLGEHKDVAGCASDWRSNKPKKSKKKSKSKDRDSSKAPKKEKKSKKDCEKNELDFSGEKREFRSCDKSQFSKDEGTDSEEERWLTAIETGKLDEVDEELKRMRNPRLLTARQRALLGKQRLEVADVAAWCATSDPADHKLTEEQLQQLIPSEPLLALPTGIKEKELTQEMLEKKAIKSQRRRAQALEKREEDKKKTVDRLLKKQDPKILKTNYAIKKSLTPYDEVLMFSYKDNTFGTSVFVPPGVEYPLQTAVAPSPPTVKLCGVPGCRNPKRYSCSQTGRPLCSLQCYQANLAASTR